MQHYKVIRYDTRVNLRSDSYTFAVHYVTALNYIYLHNSAPLNNQKHENPKLATSTDHNFTLLFADSHPSLFTITWAHPRFRMYRHSPTEAFESAIEDYLILEFGAKSREPPAE